MFDVLSPYAERLVPVLTWGIVTAVAVLFAVRLWKRLWFGPAHELVTPAPVSREETNGDRESQAA